MWGQFTSSECEFEYISNMPTVTNVICTILIVGFTVFLEIAVHGKTDCCTTISDENDQSVDTDPDATSREVLLPTIVIEQPGSYKPLPSHAPSVNAEIQDAEVEQSQLSVQPDFCCYPNPSPNVRANRLITAVFLYAVVLAAFITRMHEIKDPYIRPECRRYVSIPEPNWWGVVLLNILPVIAASFSLMRTVVDCLLVRWGQGLTYGGQTGGSAWLTWAPCMPFYLVYIGVGGLFKWPIGWLMGKHRSRWSATRTAIGMRGDIEMQGEEATGLIDDVDGEGSVDGPPAYDGTVYQAARGQAEMGK
ncbi:hypothetical protein EKO04_010567 [Ascochyta lentis]|uniref:Uncharacterized protein n=1 Tax=Ascochyta lentis TaxID=205686 RepID=A0A8H7IV38_9PLEO|nr:hypothetical protein EKO04_010567 [Ascochyta lentis]